MLVDIPQPVEDEADIVVPLSLLRSANGVLPRSFADRLSRSANGCPERIVRNPASRRPPSGAASSVCSSKSPNRRTARRKCGSVTPSLRRSAVDGRSRVSLVGQAAVDETWSRTTQAALRGARPETAEWLEMVRETLTEAVVSRIRLLTNLPADFPSLVERRDQQPAVVTRPGSYRSWPCRALWSAQPRMPTRMTHRRPSCRGPPLRI